MAEQTNENVVVEEVKAQATSDVQEALETQEDVQPVNPAVEKQQRDQYRVLACAEMDRQLFDSIKAFENEEAKNQYVHDYAVTSIFRSIIGYANGAGINLMTEFTIENLLNDENLEKVLLPALVKNGVVISANSVLGNQAPVSFRTELVDQGAAGNTAKIEVISNHSLALHVVRVMGALLCRQVYNVTEYFRTASEHVFAVDEYETFDDLRAFIDSFMGAPENNQVQ